MLPNFRIKNDTMMFGKWSFYRIKIFYIFVSILMLTISLPALAPGSFEEGYELYKKGKYYEAETILLREKELSPKNLDVYAVLGWIYLYTGRYVKAIEISEEGLKISSTEMAPNTFHKFHY